MRTLTKITLMVVALLATPGTVLATASGGPQQPPPTTIAVEITTPGGVIPGTPGGTRRG